jgi:signal transduction histidine kinase
LRRIEAQTSNLWTSHRTSLVVLFLGALTLSLLLGAAISGWLTRSLNRPLAAMSEAASALARGDHDHALPTESRDELGDLARAFQSMSQDVKAHQAALQEETSRLRKAEAERSELLADLGRKNAELERFTYTVSHDLKGPLVTIQGFTGMIEAELGANASPQIRKDLSRITGAADKMQSLLTDLLELSRIGRIVNPAERVPFGDIAREAVELLHGPIHDKGAQVIVASDLPTVTVDRRRLVEVVQNLIENAIKFTAPERAPRIEIGMAPGKDRVFEVKDNGQGIDAAFIDRIFNIFEKLDPKAEGTGVGLSLVRRIVEAHEGQVWAASPGIGQGTAFYFTLGPDCWKDSD